MNKIRSWSVALAMLALPSYAAIEPGNAGAEYERLQKWAVSPLVPLTAPVILQRDTATWTLQSGTVRLMEPASDGTVTGIVFEGQGRFTMTIPDRFELAQLRRFTKKPELASIDQPFTQLVLRTSDAAVVKLFPAAPAGAAYARTSLIQKRHEASLIDNLDDPDARVLAALLNGTSFLSVDTKTADFDWLAYDYDATRGEEIRVTKLYSGTTESWISLDRPEDRQKDGRPGPDKSPLASLGHIDVKADLTKAGRMGEVGRHNQRTIDGRYVVEATFTGLAESLSALTVELTPFAREVKAFDEDGAPLTLLRDAIGKRSATLDNRIHDDSVVVVLYTPLTRGQKRRLRFEYTLETANYAPGRSWYPAIPDAFEQKHTARLELTVQKKNELRAMGRMESRSEEPSSETSIWVVERPAKMITFSTATRFEEVKVTAPTIPAVISFGPDYQLGNTAKVRNVGADVANSMQFFQSILGEKIAGDQFYVTSIAAGHGQAFDGFLHMSEWTFASEHPGASELFRAHEVAHEWFGHKVGWATYRDQWLSEALAEYVAIMFVERFVKGGNRHYEEILDSYTGIVMGNMAGGFSKFNRPWLIERNSQERKRVGPIGHGYRAATGDIPAAYLIQTYYKAPMVLHMLRMFLRYKTQSDELFVKVLRDYVTEYNGKAASTADFRRVLEKNAPADWSWFFDSWVYSGDVPSYTWRYDAKPTDGGYLLTIDLERRDVDESFATIIPVRVDLGGGKHGYVFINNTQSRQTVTQKVSAKPTNVVFAPDHSVLASIRKN